MRKSVWIVCILVIGLLPLASSSGCQIGNYSHNGNTCCLCSKGYFVLSHCDAANPQPKCEHCPTGTYAAEANSEGKCEQCSVCNSKANLEEEGRCTTISDVVCRCMKGFFCESEHCKACHPCEECDFGVEEPCTPRKNTVCKKTSDGIGIGAGVGIAVAVIATAALICGALWWKKKFCFAKKLTPAVPEVGLLLKGIDLNKFIDEIVEHLSWSDMRKVAARTGMSPVQVDRHKHDNPGSEEEQTRSLLIAWIEKQGLQPASESFFQTLRKCNLNHKADKIELLITEKADV
ncbi:tumor necrosis factor receptor superfamily member 6 [Sardina pilchardus]|uniref:tumor necrosis factor receptor superfamily member 6 n=1 Tax=Sardina pilchardus TaxID=27697 RepID=UPI002E117D2D